MRGHGHKLKYRKHDLNMKSPFFNCEVGQPLQQVAQRVCGVSIHRDLINLNGHGPMQCVLGDPTLSRSVCGESGLDGFQRDLPMPSIM